MRYHELPPLLDAAFGNHLPSGISLPSDNCNAIPSIVPRERVCQAYWQWVIFAEREVGLDWFAWVEELFERRRDPILYGINLFKRRLGNLQGSLARTMRPDFTLAQKRATFELHFDLSYPPEPAAVEAQANGGRHE